MKKNIKLILIFSVIAAFAFASSGCFTTMAIFARTAEAANESSSTFEFSYGNSDWKDPFDTDDDRPDYDLSDPDDFEDAIESFMSEFSSALEDDYNNNKDDDEDDSDDFRTDAGRS